MRRPTPQFGAAMRLTFGVVHVSAILAICLPASCQLFTFTDLGMPGDQLSRAFGVNDRGDVVGEYVSTGGTAHAFLYNKTGRHDLGVLTGGSYSAASSVNASGFIVGFGDTTAEGAGGATHPFVVNSQGMHDLGNISHIDYDGYGYGINDAGHIVGSTPVASGISHAFLHDGQSMHDLGTLWNGDVAFSSALSINDHDVVVGESTTAPTAYQYPGPIHAFRYDSAGIHDLGTIGGAFGRSVATGINDYGVIVGTSITPSGAFDAFRYDTSGMHDLGALAYGSSASAINDIGEVVGISAQTDLLGSAFLYNSTGLHDLNTLTGGLNGFRLEGAYGVSDSGLIVGYGHTATNGTSIAFLLTPAAVPEPGPFVLYGTGVSHVLLQAFLRRRSAAS